LFEKLVAKSHGIENAINAAEILINDKDGVVRYSTYELFKKLIEKGYGIEKAINAAESLTDRGDAFAMRLFEKLIEKGYGIEKAIHAAENLGDNRLKKKFQEKKHQLSSPKNRQIEGAILVANDFIRKEDPKMRSRGLKMFKSLVEQGHGIDHVINAAKNL